LHYFWTVSVRLVVLIDDKSLGEPPVQQTAVCCDGGERWLQRANRHRIST
jgi:hypothetical protein